MYFPYKQYVLKNVASQKYSFPTLKTVCLMHTGAQPIAVELVIEMQIQAPWSLCL